MANNQIWLLFTEFLKLGFTSFGGPLVHVAIFRQRFVEQKAWFSETQFAQWMLLTQFIPGPSSSQLGFLIGYQRAGWAGALAAFIGFTLPSALLMALFAYGLLGSGLLGWQQNLTALLPGLVILAAALMIQASIGLSKPLVKRHVGLIGLIGLSALVLWLSASAWAIIGWLALMAGLGWLHSVRPVLVFNMTNTLSEARLGQPSKHQAWWLIGVFFLLLLGFMLIASASESFSLLASLYQAGALVWGGGQVVLPYLYVDLVETGQVDEQAFLAGFALAQAVPGPMFSFAAYLGMLIGGSWLALLATVFFFLPGLVLIIAVLPFYQGLIHRPALQAGLVFMQAGLVGLFIAVLIHPILPMAVNSVMQAVLLVINLVWLMLLRQSFFWLIPLNLLFIGLWL